MILNKYLKLIMKYINEMYQRDMASGTLGHDWELQTKFKLKVVARLCLKLKSIGHESIY